MKRILFAILMLSSLLAHAANIKIDMRDVWSAERLAGRVVCAPGTGTPEVPCIAAAKDYAFTAQNCGFLKYLGQTIADCVVLDDFGARTLGFATNNGNGWRMAYPPIKDPITDADVQVVGTVATYGTSILAKMNEIFSSLFVPSCPNPGVYYGHLVDRLAYDLASNVLTVDPHTGVLSLPPPVWPHANCPQ